ncbi:MAG: TonB-dependent receptor [Odoribacteraceae bacterium]|jgi:outer membrane cobalamin receptor|nr:TonB-dependent receptor [Odoribacteraceae bacterium]
MHARQYLLLASLLAAALPAVARQDSTRHLDAVIVLGRQARQEILPVQSLAGKELQRLSVHSVADAVRYFSGVQVKDYGGIGGLKTVNIRGMGSHHVGVFYDGIELGNAQNGVIDLGRFSLDNMEAITVYNGQKSAILQTAKDHASASAIYMTSRRPLLDDGNGKRHRLNLALKGGSFATINPSVLWEFRVNTRLALSASAEYLYTSGRYKFSYTRKNGYDTTETRRNGDLRAARLEAAIHGKNNRGDDWNAKLYHYRSERGYPGASVREEPGKFKHQDRQWDNNLFLQVTACLHPAARYSLAANAKYARDYLRYLSDPRLDVTTMHVDNRYLQQEIYASLAHLITIAPRIDASLANDIQYNTLDADLVDFARPTRYTFLTALSLSLDLPSLDLQASLLHTLASDKTRAPGARAGTVNTLSPSIVASAEITPGITARAFYKKSSRLPTFNDLYYTFIGNKELQPEHVEQLNAGITITRPVPRLEIQVDAYLNRVKNKIIAMPTSNQFRWTMINLGRVHAGGIDASARLVARAGNVEITPRLSYSYQRARDLSEPGDRWHGGQIPYIPRHAASLVAGVAYRAWTINYSFIYTGERYDSVANIPANHLQPWYTHDAAVSATFRAGSAVARVTAEINNILDQQYEVVRCYPMPGTNVKLKLNITP